MSLVGSRGRHVTLTGVDDQTDEPYVTRAFLPAALPDDPGLATTTWREVVEAHEATVRLTALLSRAPACRALLARSEAAGTLCLAGERTTLRELLVAETLDGLGDRERRTIAAIETLGTDGLGATADARVAALATSLAGTTAVLRRGPGYVASPGAPIAQASYVGPPGGPDLEDAFDAWASWARGVALPAVVAGALSQLQLETIRPWPRGNSVVARLALLDAVARTADGAVVPVSAWWSRDQTEHTAVLARARIVDDLDAWVTAVAASVGAAATRVEAWLTDVLDGLAVLRRELTDAAVRGVAVDVVDELAAVPVTTVAQLATRHDVTFQTANVAVARLVEHGALEQLTPGSYDRVFGCPIVLGE